MNIIPGVTLGVVGWGVKAALAKFKDIEQDIQKSHDSLVAKIESNRVGFLDKIEANSDKIESNLVAIEGLSKQISNLSVRLDTAIEMFKSFWSVPDRSPQNMSTTKTPENLAPASKALLALESNKEG